MYDNGVKLANENDVVQMSLGTPVNNTHRGGGDLLYSLRGGRIGPTVAM